MVVVGPRDQATNEFAGRVALRTRVAVTAGAAAGRLSRLIGRGSGGTIPGKVALRLAPLALAQLSAGRPVLLVSGTNGKTTTTRYLAAGLRAAGPVVSNDNGDNLAAGLASAVLRARRDRTSPLVLEVDEVTLPFAMAQTRPAVAVLLNLSRDQLDRTGEVASNVDRWTRAVAAAPGCVVVANADDPLIAATVTAARPGGEDVVWVGAGSRWRADAALCSCGGALAPDRDYQCARCDFHRPAPSWEVAGTVLRRPDGPDLTLALGLPGSANRGNAAMATAAAAQLGVRDTDALNEMAAVSTVSGRYLRAMVAGHDLQFLLAKNPAGWSEALDVVAERDTPVVICINARDADGTDPSWLWDAPFERIAGRAVVATGERRWDLAVRLAHAEVAHTVAADVVSALATLPAGRCDVVANYTAFRQAQARLLGPRGSSKTNA